MALEEGKSRLNKNKPINKEEYKRRLGREKIKVILKKQLHNKKELNKKNYKKRKKSKMYIFLEFLRLSFLLNHLLTNISRKRLWRILESIQHLSLLSESLVSQAIPSP